MAALFRCSIPAGLFLYTRIYTCCIAVYSISGLLPDAGWRAVYKKALHNGRADGVV